MSDEVPAFPHAGRERLIVHRTGLDPFADGRAFARQIVGFGLISDLVVMGVHGKSQVGKDVNEWVEASNMTRFGHVHSAGGQP